MNSIIDNVTALITLYAPVVGTYVIQIIQWLVMQAKMKATAKAQEKLFQFQEDKLKIYDSMMETNR